MARLVHCQREESIAIVEDGRSSYNLICIVVDQIAEIAKMAVCIEDDCIEEENVRKARILKRLIP